MANDLPKEFVVRNAASDDHARIQSIMRDWWGGRDLTWMLPRLFLIHFSNTSFVIERDSELVAFLIGFLSPALPDEGYIHLVGTAPMYRNIGIGRYLYQMFFDLCKMNNRSIIRSCTSPVNAGSIRFHKNNGFRIEPGNSEINGISVTLDYNRPNDSKVLFSKRI